MDGYSVPAEHTSRKEKEKKKEKSRTTAIGEVEVRKSRPFLRGGRGRGVCLKKKSPVDRCPAL
jgi:hypothetical protein